MPWAYVVAAPARGAFWACALVVLALGLMPAGLQLPTTGWDKTNHLLAFGILSLLGHWAYPRSTGRLLLGLLAYGGLIELLQSLTPDRFGEWADLVADGVGLLLGGMAKQVFAWWPLRRDAVKTTHKKK